MSEEMAHDDDQMLAAEYALDLLTGDELAEAHRRVTSDPAFAATVARWEIELADLAVELPPEPVPAEVKSRLEMRLFGASPAPVSSRMRAFPWMLGVACRVTSCGRNEGSVPAKPAGPAW